MNMEVLIKKPRPVLESAHQDLTNRGSLELIGHFFLEKVGFGNNKYFLQFNFSEFLRMN